MPLRVVNDGEKLAVAMPVTLDGAADNEIVEGDGITEESKVRERICKRKDVKDL